MSDTPSTDPAFTPKEIEYMAAVMMCLKEGVPTNAQIDIDRFTAMTKLTAGSAKVIWNGVRRKLVAQALASGAATPKTTEGKSKPKATPNPKRKTEDGDEGVEATPSKKPRAQKVKTPAKRKEGGSLDEEGEEVKDEVVKDEEA